MDTEQLIKLVEERRLLYDQNHDDYKERHKKAQAWKEIASIMGAHNASYWLTKWKSLRDNYNKYRRNFCSNDPMYHKYRNWPWASCMKFMDDYVIQRPTSNANTVPNDPLLTETQDESKTFDESPNFEHSEPENDTEPPEVIKNPIKNRTKARRLKRIPNSKTRLVKKTFDEIDLFFLSYAKNLKRLSRKSQALMKLEIASLFTRFELNENAEANNRESITFVVSEESRSSLELEEVNFKMEC